MLHDVKRSSIGFFELLGFSAAMHAYKMRQGLVTKQFLVGVSGMSADGSELYYKAPHH